MSGEGIRSSCVFVSGTTFYIMISLVLASRSPTRWVRSLASCATLPASTLQHLRDVALVHQRFRPVSKKSLQRRMRQIGIDEDGIIRFIDEFGLVPRDLHRKRVKRMGQRWKGGRVKILSLSLTLTSPESVPDCQRFGPSLRCLVHHLALRMQRSRHVGYSLLHVGAMSVPRRKNQEKESS